MEPPPRAPEGTPGRFLCAAKKQIYNKTSYYLISMEEDPSDRGSESVLGKVARPNAASRLD
jgi:hypothetical protein